MTAYHFESTDKFEENLKILLDFVSVPWLQRKASIRSRNNRAGNRMYEDSPDWRVMENMFAAMFSEHPSR
jgi:predicted Zn-dependent peptidase